MMRMIRIILNCKLLFYIFIIETIRYLVTSLSTTFTLSSQHPFFFSQF